MGIKCEKSANKREKRLSNKLWLKKAHKSPKKEEEKTDLEAKGFYLLTVSEMYKKSPSSKRSSSG